MNALKHGLRARTPVLPGEDAEEYERLKKSAYSLYGSENDFERFVVARYVNAAWRARRVERVVDENLRQAAEMVAASSASRAGAGEPLSPQQIKANSTTTVLALREGRPAVDTSTRVLATADVSAEHPAADDDDRLLCLAFGLAHEQLDAQITNAERYLASALNAMARIGRELAAMQTIRGRNYKARICSKTGIRDQTLDSVAADLHSAALAPGEKSSVMR